MEWLAEIIRKIHCAARVGCFQQEYSFSEDLAEVRTVDLIDVEEVVVRGIVASFSGGLHQSAACWLESKSQIDRDICGREATDETLVCCIRVKLNCSTSATIVLIQELRSHHRLPGSRRTLKHDVTPATQQPSDLAAFRAR